MSKHLFKTKKVYSVIFILIILLAALFLYQKKETKILFVGDMFFDRQIRKVMYSKGGDFVFSCIGDFLKDSDLVVGNLEGPVTENASVSLLSQVDTPVNYTFTFPTNVPDLLRKYNIKLVNLGNNHIGNFGQSGIDSTKKYLKEAGVNYFGDLSGNEPIYRTNFGNKKISFISYNEFGLPAQAGGDSAQKVAQKISDEKKNGQTVIVYAHWGDEYAAVPSRVKNIAQLFAKNGADLIVGSHPHVVLENKIITSPLPSPYLKERETAVYYSLGNFIFDQYWNKEVSTGLVLEVSIKGDDFKITEHKVSLNRDGRTCLVN